MPKENKKANQSRICSEAGFFQDAKETKIQRNVIKLHNDIISYIPFTKNQIKENLIELRKKIAAFEPIMEKQMAIVEQKDQAIKLRRQQIAVQNTQIEHCPDEKYELDFPIYPLYISYLLSLRELGFVVMQVRQFNLCLEALANAVKRLVLRIDRYFPNDEEAGKTRLEFTKIAFDCEDTRDLLSGVTHILGQEMTVIADRYVKSSVFKAGIDAEILALEAGERELLWQWCKPWVESMLNVLPREDVLDVALKTLKSDQPASAILLCH